MDRVGRNERANQVAQLQFPLECRQLGERSTTVRYARLGGDRRLLGHAPASREILGVPLARFDATEEWREHLPIARQEFGRREGERRLPGVEFMATRGTPRCVTVQRIS